MFRTYFLLPLLLPLVWVRRDLSAGLMGRIGGLLGRIAARPARAIALVGALSFFLSAGIALRIGMPVPETQDEFGYLLLGDTFAHGRLTNPTPELWKHFETIHEIMHPSYTAKYPPAQGAALAVGQRLGHPIIGVWLTTALACAAMCWMLFAWMPPRWALAGGLLTVFHPQIIAWSQNYWGGAVAVGGGALVLGAFRNVLRGEYRRNAIVMGIGIGVLANSRPFEGLVFVVLTGIALLILMARSRGPGPRLPAAFIGPLAIVLGLFAAQIGFYNWRVTGDPLLMPYTVHIRTYGIDPAFALSPPRPEPAYNHREIRNLHELYLRYYLEQTRSPEALFVATIGKIVVLIQGYLWSLLLVAPLLALPGVIRRDRLLRVIFFIGLFFTSAILLETWMHEHYAAPAAAVFFLLVVASTQAIYHWRPAGRAAGRNIMAGMMLLFAFSTVRTVQNLASANDPRLWNYRRHAIIGSLREMPGKSLVIIKYDERHNPHREWVYNDADLDNSKVLLARDMGPDENQRLLNHYPDRKAYVVHADAAEPKPEPYPGS